MPIFSLIKRKLSRKTKNSKPPKLRLSVDSEQLLDESCSIIATGSRYPDDHGWERFLEETFAIPGCDCVFCLLRCQQSPMPRNVTAQQNMVHPSGLPQANTLTIPPMSSVFEVLYPNIPRPPPSYDERQAVGRSSRRRSSLLRQEAMVPELTSSSASNLPPYTLHDPYRP